MGGVEASAWYLYMWCDLGMFNGDRSLQTRPATVVLRWSLASGFDSYLRTGRYSSSSPQDMPTPDQYQKSRAGHLLVAPHSNVYPCTTLSLSIPSVILLLRVSKSARPVVSSPKRRDYRLHHRILFLPSNIFAKHRHSTISSHLITSLHFRRKDGTQVAYIS